jgi:hypothetical protein
MTARAARSLAIDLAKSEQQQDDASGTLPTAVAGFMVLARGTYTMAADILAEAGRVETRLSGTSHVLPFSRPFNHIPVVMTTVTSVNVVKPVNSHVQAVTKSVLSVDLHGGGATTRAGSHERLSYTAWGPSAGWLQRISFEVSKALGVGHGQRHSLPFRRALDTPPVLLAEVQGVCQEIP